MNHKNGMNLALLFLSLLYSYAEFYGEAVEIKEESILLFF